MDSKTRKTQWHSGLVSPSLWANIAPPTLMRAAGLIWKRFEMASNQNMTNAARLSVAKRVNFRDIPLCSVAFMLAAFALENLLKGIWVKRMDSEQPLVEDDKRIKKIFDTHDLVKLAAKAGIPCDASRTELFERLTIEMVWGGRYSRPIRPDHFFPNVPGKPEQIKMRHFHPADWESVVQVYNELYLMLRPAARAKTTVKRAATRSNRKVT
jgi:hypothetical protein